VVCNGGQRVVARARLPSLAVIAESIGDIVKREQPRIFAGLIKKQALPKHFRTLKKSFACLRLHADVGVRGVRCIVRGRVGQDDDVEHRQPSIVHAVRQAG
jgi:hypothetical protein